MFESLENRTNENNLKYRQKLEEQLYGLYGMVAFPVSYMFDTEFDYNGQEFSSELCSLGELNLRN